MPTPERYREDAERIEDLDAYDFARQRAFERRLARKCWGTPDCGCPYCCPEDFEAEDEQ